MPPLACVGTAAASMGTVPPRASADSSGSNIRRSMKISIVVPASNGLRLFGSSVTAMRSTPACDHGWRMPGAESFFVHPAKHATTAANSAVAAFIALLLR